MPHLFIFSLPYCQSLSIVSLVPSLPSVAVSGAVSTDFLSLSFSISPSLYPSSYLRYSIDPQSDPEALFRIAPDTGLITTAMELDREHEQWHNVTIIATQRGTHGPSPRLRIQLCNAVRYSYSTLSKPLVVRKACLDGSFPYLCKVFTLLKYSSVPVRARNPHRVYFYTQLSVEYIFPMALVQ